MGTCVAIGKIVSVLGTGRRWFVAETAAGRMAWQPLERRA